MKAVRLSRHASDYRVSRGFTEQEVIEAIRSGEWQPAKLGRLECSKDFAFESHWNGVYYQTKQVRPVFVQEADEIVVVTVYTAYF